LFFFFFFCDFERELASSTSDYILLSFKVKLVAFYAESITNATVVPEN
jgi:hypothetical protein